MQMCARRAAQGSEYRMLRSLIQDNPISFEFLLLLGCDDPARFLIEAARWCEVAYRETPVLQASTSLLAARIATLHAQLKQTLRTAEAEERDVFWQDLQDGLSAMLRALYPRLPAGVGVVDQVPQVRIIVLQHIFEHDALIDAGIPLFLLNPQTTPRNEIRLEDWEFFVPRLPAAPAGEGGEGQTIPAALHAFIACVFGTLEVVDALGLRADLLRMFFCALLAEKEEALWAMHWPIFDEVLRGLREFRLTPRTLDVATALHLMGYGASLTQ